MEEKQGEKQRALEDWFFQSRKVLRTLTIWGWVLTVGSALFRLMQVPAADSNLFITKMLVEFSLIYCCIFIVVCVYGCIRYRRINGKLVKFIAEIIFVNTIYFLAL